MARIAVVGAGAIGGYYGARLAQAGHDVHFLMRGDFDAVRAHGLEIRSKDGDFRLDTPQIHRDSGSIGAVEWVVCALKATALADARALIAPCIGADTRILAIMNGLGVEDRFAEWFGASRIFGGLAFTCINREAPGLIHHIDYGAITIGHFLDRPEAVEDALELWAQARVKVAGTASLLQARWRKLLWNVPFNGLAVAAGGITTDRIMGDADLRAAAESLMSEVVAAANADLAAHGQPPMERDRELSAMMAATEAMAVYSPSTMLDFVAGRPLEVDAIFAEPLRRAQALGVSTPYLALLTALMRALDPGRRVGSGAAGAASESVGSQAVGGATERMAGNLPDGRH